MQKILLLVAGLAFAYATAQAFARPKAEPNSSSAGQRSGKSGTKDIPARTSNINPAQGSATGGKHRPPMNPAQGTTTPGVKNLPTKTTHIINPAQGSATGGKKR